MSDDSRVGAAMVPEEGISEEVDVDFDDMNAPASAKPSSSASSATDIAVAPRAALPAGGADAESNNARASEPPPGDGHAEPRKPRARMLRVPDDEVVRPQGTFTRTGETRVFRADELEKEAADAVSRPAARPSGPVQRDDAAAPPPMRSGAPSQVESTPPTAGTASAPAELPRARAPSMSTEVTRASAPRPISVEPPRPRLGSISNELALPAPPPPRPRMPSVSPDVPGPPPPPPPRPRMASVSSEVAASPPPRPRMASVSSEGPAPPPLRPRMASVTSEGPVPPPLRPRQPSVSSEASPPHRPPARSVSSEITTKTVEILSEAALEADPSTEEIKPARIISFHPSGPSQESEVPADGPTLAELPPARDSADMIPVAVESSRDPGEGIPVIEDVEPSRRGAATHAEALPTAAPRTPTISTRMPAMTVPDADGSGMGIDISVDEEANDAPPEPEVASDDLLSIESAPDFPHATARNAAAAASASDHGARVPIPPIGMSSDPNVAALTQTPAGGIQAVPAGAPAPAAAHAHAAAPAPAAAPPPAAAGSAPGAAAAPAATAVTSAPAVAAAIAPTPLHESRGASRLPSTKASVELVPPDASPLAPQPMGDAAANRKRLRPWWEELFNDDFIRTMAKITDDQIAREVDFIEDSLGVARGAMILDMACGTGRHAIELTRRGYRVVGLDLSLAMLAKAADEAHERNQKLNFVQGDMREMTFEDMFDGVYCWNTSFGFFEEERNAQVVQRVHRALRKGGQFVLDVMNRDFALLQQPSLVWFEGDGCICMDEMQIDWITSRMRVKRTMMMDDGRSREIEYSLRIYSLHELGKILHDHGFRVAEVSGRTATPGVFFGAESPNVLVLAEKR